MAVRTLCYDAGPHCTCRKEPCGGVQTMYASCPEHGSEGPATLRVHFHQKEVNRESIRSRQGRR